MAVPDDSDVVYVMQWCRAIGVEVRLRGTDQRPVVVVQDRIGKGQVGGSELRRRIERNLGHE